MVSSRREPREQRNIICLFNALFKMWTVFGFFDVQVHKHLGPVIWAVATIGQNGSSNTTYYSIIKSFLFWRPRLFKAVPSEIYFIITNDFLTRCRLLIEVRLVLIRIKYLVIILYILFILLVASATTDTQRTKAAFPHYALFSLPYFCVLVL